MGGNVERHIGDDDRYGAAIEVMRDAEPTSDDVSFQDRVDPWMQACFGAEISADKLERGDRLLEEVLELLQSGDYPSERIAALTKYVWSREIGEPAQEVGGVMVTLAAYCLAHGLNMHTAGETELTRIWTKVDKIRAKQAAKPKGSVLPQAWPESNTPDAMSHLVEAARAVVLAYQEANPMRTAAMHPDECDCLRCKIDCLEYVLGESRREADHD